MFFLPVQYVRYLSAPRSSDRMNAQTMVGFSSSRGPARDYEMKMDLKIQSICDPASSRVFFPACRM